MPRAEFGKTVRGLAADRAAGHCEKCAKKLRIGEFHYDHIVPDGLGGKPTLENCMVLCLSCHKVKTVTEDMPRMTKADNQRQAIAQNIRSTGRKIAEPMPARRATRPIEKFAMLKTKPLYRSAP